MPVFEYRAFDKSGKEIKGKEEALSQEQLRAVLERKGLIPYEIKPVQNVEKRSFSFRRKRISDSDVALILYEMGTLFEKGLHITDIFDILAKQFENSPLEEVFLVARSKVSEGMPVGEAMRETGVFPDFVSEMVLAGEESGALGKILISAAKFVERETEFRNKIKGALTYPVIVLVVGFLSMFIVMKVAVPKIVKIYTQFNQDIPASTKAVLYFSFFISFLFKLLPFVAAFLFVFRRKFLNKETIDRLKLKIPFYKDIQLYSIYTSWSNTLSLLLGGGLPLDEAVEVANKTVGNVEIKKKFEPIPEWIREGKRLSEYLRVAKALPDAAVRLIMIGEETGEMEEMLSLVSSIYRKETEKMVTLFMSYLEPATLLVLAVFVAFFVFATILPIFNLTVK
ncbi:type II secretion system F family protein [Desulfurobacterium atlanticum]|uniref:Type IV pilus assembly protein PilC n=1 Tax=Desulfurobacterium atlanticum TaxID=240169 RepID=A0A238ZCA4_9BACT|nr:type II secretion system F family protein [Desulfurobacterium atlanticum]SNR80628.1 type IV pilus assembly protein PilC [Desulfurobacterium atlanticum]